MIVSEMTFYEWLENQIANSEGPAHEAYVLTMHKLNAERAKGEAAMEEVTTSLRNLRGYLEEVVYASCNHVWGKAYPITDDEPQQYVCINCNATKKPDDVELTEEENNHYDAYRDA